MIWARVADILSPRFFVGRVRAVAAAGFTILLAAYYIGGGLRVCSTDRTTLLTECRPVELTEFPTLIVGAIYVLLAWPYLAELSLLGVGIKRIDQLKAQIAEQTDDLREQERMLRSIELLLVLDNEHSYGDIKQITSSLVGQAGVVEPGTDAPEDLRERFHEAFASLKLRVESNDLRLAASRSSDLAVFRRLNELRNRLTRGDTVESSLVQAALGRIGSLAELRTLLESREVSPANLVERRVRETSLTK